MANLAPILLGGVALLVMAKGKKKKTKTKATSAGRGAYSRDAYAGLSLDEAKSIKELPKFSPGPSDASAGKAKWVKRQNALISLGYPVGSKGADGIYGKDTKAAIVKFQTDAGFDAKGIDGIWGPITDAAISEALKKKAEGKEDPVDASIGDDIEAAVGSTKQTEPDGGPWGGSFGSVEFAVHRIEGEYEYEYAGEVLTPTYSEQVASGPDFDTVWKDTQDAAQRISTEVTMLVFDKGCKILLNIDDELFNVQRVMAIDHALDMAMMHQERKLTDLDDEAADLHEQVVAKYAPECASLGRSGVGPDVRNWWDQNVGWFYNKLVTYFNSPDILESDAEKYGV